MFEAINDNADPFFHNAKINFGIYKGQYINTERKKTLTILHGSQYNDDYPQKENHYLVANIYHNGEYYIGQIPSNSVTEVLYALEPFNGVFAHTMMRFVFRTPIYLIAKTPTKEDFVQGKAGDILEKPLILNDLLFSVEATAPPGIEEFAFVASFFYTRGLCFRVLSLTGRGIKKYTSGEAEVNQYKLKLTIEEANTLFTSIMIKGHNRTMRKMYQTLFANCNWFTFEMLQHSHKFVNRQQNLLQNGIGVVKYILNKFIIFGKIYPPLAIFGLTWRNIRDKDAVKSPNLEKDEAFLKLVAENTNQDI